MAYLVADTPTPMDEIIHQLNMDWHAAQRQAEDLARQLETAQLDASARYARLNEARAIRVRMMGD